MDSQCFEKRLPLGTGVAARREGLLCQKWKGLSPCAFRVANCLCLRIPFNSPRPKCSRVLHGLAPAEPATSNC